MTNALPITSLIGTVLVDRIAAASSPWPCAAASQWYRESAEALRWSPITHSRPFGTVTGPNRPRTSGPE